MARRQRTRRQRTPTGRPARGRRRPRPPAHSLRPLINNEELINRPRPTAHSLRGLSGRLCPPRQRGERRQLRGVGGVGGKEPVGGREGGIAQSLQSTAWRRGGGRRRRIQPNAAEYGGRQRSPCPPERWSGSASRAWSHHTFCFAGPCFSSFLRLGRRARRPAAGPRAARQSATRRCRWRARGERRP